MNQSTDQRLIGVLIALLALNLCATVYFGVRNTPVPSKTLTQYKKFNSERVDSLIKSVVNMFNTNKMHELYEQFDHAARIQFTEKEMIEKLGSLQVILGKVENFSYTESEFQGKQYDGDIYLLKYKGRLTGGNFPKAEIKMTVVDRDGKIGLLGFVVNGSI